MLEGDRVELQEMGWIVRIVTIILIVIGAVQVLSRQEYVVSAMNRKIELVKAGETRVILPHQAGGDIPRVLNLSDVWITMNARIQIAILKIPRVMTLVIRIIQANEDSLKTKSTAG